MLECWGEGDRTNRSGSDESDRLPFDSAQGLRHCRGLSGMEYWNSGMLGGGESDESDRLPFDSAQGLRHSTIPPLRLCSGPSAFGIPSFHPFDSAQGLRHSIIPPLRLCSGPSAFHHSIIPSFHHSIIPSFHRSIIPSFHRSVIARVPLPARTTPPASAPDHLRPSCHRCSGQSPRGSRAWRPARPKSPRGRHPCSMDSA